MPGPSAPEPVPEQSTGGGDGFLFLQAQQQGQAAAPENRPLTQHSIRGKKRKGSLFYRWGSHNLHMGIKHDYSISAGAAPAGIGTGTPEWFLPCPLMLRMKETACMRTGGFTGTTQGCAGWESLTASYILTVPHRGISTQDTEIAGE